MMLLLCVLCGTLREAASGVYVLPRIFYKSDRTAIDALLSLEKPTAIFR